MADTLACTAVRHTTTAMHVGVKIIYKQGHAAAVYHY